MATPIIGIVELDASTNNKFTVHNTALSEIEVYGIASVLSSLSTPPVSPTLGDFHLIYGTAVGLWVGMENSLTVWNGTGWTFYLPVLGLDIKDQDTGRNLIYNGTDWVISGGERKVNRTVGADVSPRNIDAMLQVIDPSGAARTLNLPMPDVQSDFIVVNDSDNLSGSGNTVNVFDPVSAGIIQVLDDTTGISSANFTWSQTANKWIVYS